MFNIGDKIKIKFAGKTWVGLVLEWNENLIGILGQDLKLYGIKDLVILNE